MARIIQVLGYLIFILALVGELLFVGVALPNLTVCGYSTICWGQPGYYTNNVPLPLYFSFVVWNAFTYAVLMLVGVALILIDSKERKQALPQLGP